MLFIIHQHIKETMSRQIMISFVVTLLFMAPSCHHSWKVSHFDSFLRRTTTDRWCFTSCLYSSSKKTGGNEAIRTEGGGISEEEEEEEERKREGLDDSIYNEITLAQLQLICAKYNLSTTGKKSTLLQRIKDYVLEQASKSEDDIFYFTSDDAISNKKSDHTTAKQQQQSHNKTNNRIQPDLSDGTLPISVNEQGQKVVTFYDSEDRNDLTSFSSMSNSKHNEPSSSILGTLQQQQDDVLSSSDSMMNNQKLFGKSKKQWEKEMEEAKEACQELVSTLLATTGAPGFADEFGKGLNPLEDDDDENEDDYNNNKGYSSNTYLTASAAAAAAAASARMGSSTKRRSGFDPSSIRVELLEKFSKSLRVNSGQVLKDVIREFELQAVGHDGKAADNVERGGGHYREVQKVAAFLEGFRKAEVRRIARTTATIILDTVVAEGAQGLDVQLSQMTHGDEEGELNEALVEYLNDLIRSQEQKVESEKVEVLSQPEENDQGTERHNNMNLVQSIGKEELGEEGEIIETIDMNDPLVRKQIEQEIQDMDASEDSVGPIANLSPSEQLLLLLKLVRERIKVEAAFQGDERSKNLRLLAYCLKAKSDQEVEFLITNGVGSSLDALDSFSELLTSSMEYVDSSSFQLSPSTKSPLNLRKLQSIQRVLLEITSKKKFAADSSPLPSFQ